MKKTEDKPQKFNLAGKHNAQIYAGQETDDKVLHKAIQANEEAAKLLLEDPNIFAYDEIYDDMKKEKEKPKTIPPRDLMSQQQKVQAATIQPTSKYIRAIVNSVGKREREYEIVHEKMVSKKVKREMQDAPQQIFVTSSYLKQKEAEKAYEMQQKKTEQYNELHSINNRQKNQYEFTAKLFHNQFGDTLKPEKKPAAVVEQSKPEVQKPKFYSEKAHKEKLKNIQAAPTKNSLEQTHPK